MGYEKLRPKTGGLLLKVKHLRSIDSELALRGKGEKNFREGSETEFEIARA